MLRAAFGFSPQSSQSSTEFLFFCHSEHSSFCHPEELLATKDLVCIYMYASTSAFQILRFAQDDKRGWLWMTKRGVAPNNKEGRVLINDYWLNQKIRVISVICGWKINRHQRMKNESSSADEAYPSSSSSSSSSTGLVYFTFTLLKVKDESAFESTVPGRKLILARLMSEVS